MIKCQVPPPLQCPKPGHINQTLSLVYTDQQSKKKSLLCLSCLDEMIPSQKANTISLSKYLKTLATELLSTREQDS